MSDKINANKVLFSRKTKILVLIGLITGSISPTFYSLARGNVLPSVLAEFNGMQLYAVVSITAILTMAVSTPIAGRLGDMFGRKRLYLGSVALFLLSLIGCAMSTSTWTYILSVALSGATQGFIGAFNNAIIADVVTPEERPKYVSYNSTVSSLVQLAGPLLSGLIIDTFSWRTMFLLGIPFPIISIILLMKFLPDIRQEVTNKQKIDVIGTIAFLGMIVPVLILLSLGGTLIPWRSPETVIMLVTSLVFTVILVRVDTKHEAPIISFYMFKNKAFFKLFLATLFLAIGSSATTYLPYYFQNVVGTSASLSGTLITPRSIATMIATAAVGTTMSKTGKYKEPLILMLILSVLSYGAMALLFTPTTSMPIIITTTTINGLGNVAMIVVVISIAMRILPPKDIGVGVSLITFVTSLAGSLGNAIGGLLTNTAWKATVVPSELKTLLNTTQLHQLASSSILRDDVALESIRSSLSTDMSVTFDNMILSFRQILGQGVTNLFWIMAIGCLIALVLIFTVELPKVEQ